MSEIRKRIQSPELLKVLLYRKDSYGDTLLDKTIKKIAYTEEIATSFGFDPNIASAIVVINDLAKPCYGEIGDKFLKEIDPNYTRSKYLERLANKVFYGIKSKNTNAIISGVNNVFQKKHETPEEQIALMIEKGFEFADSLDKKDLASLFISRYKDSIIEKTAKAGVLTEYVIPENTLAKREKINLSPEESLERLKTLKRAHQYYMENIEKIPKTFKEGWGDISNELLVAYYVVGSDDKVLTKFTKTSKDKSDSTEVEI